ncbi:MAG TPA: bifunctional hydroxymethylpyrimidine kinase/phosphomethylpyrimidine kinase [Acidobacteriaceae bacterium]
MERHKSLALTIAGFDPSSGAGIGADLKVFSIHGVYGVSAITALTVQSTQGVRKVEPIWDRVLRETIECLADDLSSGYARFDGVKIGMLGSAPNVRAVVNFLRAAPIPRERIVLDPVIRSSSGTELLDPVGVGVLRDDLIELVGWVTPNVDELGVLTGGPVAGRDDIPERAARLAGRGSGLHVVVTGGHLDTPDDFLRTSEGAENWLPGSRIDTTSTHGTGCVFSSALLCRLISGDGPLEAVRGAKEFVRRALETAVPVGKGKGPALSGM